MPHATARRKGEVPVTRRFRTWLAVIPLALLAMCARAADAPPPADGSDARANLRIVMVTHGQPADPFWSVVSNGARDAANDLGLKLEYQAPRSFDMVEMSNLIDAAVASRPNGLIVSIPDASALGSAIRAAIAAGIPVISINSGGDAYRDLGVLAHVGQSEYEAGLRAGERMAAAGVRNALCVNHEVGNASQDLRCKGLSDGLARAGGRARVLGVSLTDPDETQQRVASALAGSEAVDGILTLGPNGADPTLAALRQAGRAGNIAFGTFDLTTAVLEAVRDGAMLFAIDQQQYLQGYLPVIALVKYLETGTLPGGGDIIRTGPGFVTRETAAAVMDFTARGIR
jgi:simple sugar transport system substrate-binding protein